MKAKWKNIFCPRFLPSTSKRISVAFFIVDLQTQHFLTNFYLVVIGSVRRRIEHEAEIKFDSISYTRKKYVHK
jgi:hypothetical protein